MKLNKKYLFFILLGILILSNLGCGAIKGFKEAVDGDDEDADEDAGEEETGVKGSMGSYMSKKFDDNDAATALMSEGGGVTDNESSVTPALTTESADFSELTEGLHGGDILDADDEEEAVEEEEEGLLTKMVPPICPKCPEIATCPRQKPCPPCPACARCPEPQFTCKKVPDYSAVNNQHIPKPLLNDFSALSSL